MRTLVLRTLATLLLWLTSVAMLGGQDARTSGSAVLRLSTRSPEARAAFFAGVDAVENQLPKHAERHFLRALQADSGLGVARAFLAAFAPALTPDQRRQELQRAAADAMNATVAELLVVLALRAPAGAERRSLLKPAVDAVPDDRHVLYQYAANTTDVTERIRLLESLTRRFPDFAPPYNLLAYAKARDLGDVAAGLVLVDRYLKLAPDNPNAHDSHAELLQWSGRLDEATTHYLQAIMLDPGYGNAHAGLGEIALLQGNGAAARAHFQNAIRQASTQQQRLQLRQQIATSYIVDGNVATTLTEFRALAQEAETQGLHGVAAQAYRNMAVVDAVLGTKTLVDAHLRKAEALSSANTPIQRGFVAAAYALAGDPTAAKPIAAAITAAASTSGSPLFKRQAAALNEIVEYAAGNTDAARPAGGSGNYGAMSKLLLAESLVRRGRRVEAKMLADEVKGHYETDLFTLIARYRAQRF